MADVLPSFCLDARRGRAPSVVLPAALEGQADPVAPGFVADLYLNLNLSPASGNRVYSVRSASGPDRGRIRAYSNAVLLTDASLVVQEAGRQQVIANRCKQVHAWVRGTVIAIGRSAILDATVALMRAGAPVSYCHAGGVLAAMPGSEPGFPVSAIGYDPYRTAVFRRLPDLSPRLPSDLDSLPAIFRAGAVIALPGGLYAVEQAWPPSPAD